LLRKTVSGILLMLIMLSMLTVLKFSLGDVPTLNAPIFELLDKKSTQVKGGVDMNFTFRNVGYPATMGTVWIPWEKVNYAGWLEGSPPRGNISEVILGLDVNGDGDESDVFNVYYVNDTQVEVDGVIANAMWIPEQIFKLNESTLQVQEKTNFTLGTKVHSLYYVGDTYARFALDTFFHDHPSPNIECIISQTGTSISSASTAEIVSFRLNKTIMSYEFNWKLHEFLIGQWYADNAYVYPLGYLNRNAVFTVELSIRGEPGDYTLNIVFNWAPDKLHRYRYCDIVEIPFTIPRMWTVDDEWTMFRHDERNTGHSLDTLIYPPLQQLWEFDAKYYIAAPPIASYDTVYVVRQDGVVYKLDAVDGSRLWERDVGYYVDSSPALGQDLVFVSLLNGTLAALNKNTGEIAWMFNTEGWTTSAATYTDGIVYVGSSRNVYAINASNGVEKWRFATDGWVEAPAVSNGVVYAGSADGRLYAIDADSGAEKWRFPATGDLGSIVGAPVVGDEIVYVPSDKLYALNASSGKELWSLIPAGDGVAVFESWSLAYGTIFRVSSSQVQAFDAATGVLKWNYTYVVDSYSWFDLGVIVANNVVYAGFGREAPEPEYVYMLVALNALDGSLIWQHTAYSYLSPIIANGKLYATSSYGNKTYCFAPVAIPDFSIMASPTSLTIQQGGSDTSVITITSIGGFNQPVQLSLSGAPSGVTTTLSPEQVTPPLDGSTTSTLTVSVSATATPGNYTLTITGTNGTTIHSVDILLEITTLSPKFKVGDWVRNTANLNVREGPGLSYSIIDTVPVGTVGQIMGGPVEADGYIWWEVYYAVEIRGWSAENWLEPYPQPICVVKLQKDGVEINEVGIWEFFDIYVGNSKGDELLKAVRFSSDDTRDGYPTGEWTKWYDWDISSEDWDAITKIKRWAFATPGYKEVWAEVKDEGGHTAVGYATIFVPAPSLPVLISPLVITPVKDIYEVGDVLEAEFTIKNVGDTAVTLDVLTVGGRLNGFIPPEGAPDFTFHSITLQPNESYQYQGTLTLNQTGNYHFFVAYYIENPTPEEKRLLDENNWNTCVELGEGLTHKDRVKNIIVYKEGTVPEEVSKLNKTINRWIDREILIPAYLIDPEVSWAGSVWMTVSSVWTHAQERYDELWLAGVDYGCMSKMEAIYAKRFLERGDIDSAKKHLQKAFLYDKVSYIFFNAATEVFDRNMQTAMETVKSTLKMIEFGVSLLNPTAGKFASYVFMVPNYIADSELVGENQSTKNLVVDLALKAIFSEYKYPQLGERTLENYLNNRVGKLTFPILQEIFKENEALQFHLSHVLKKIVAEEAEWLSKKIVDELSKQWSSITYKKFSPIELRVYDSEGKITGVVNGSARHEISQSFYRNGTITILFPSDHHTCEIAGKEEGTYGLEISFVEAWNATTFNATGIPTSTDAIHQYSIDWDALSQGEEGVTVKVDSDGDGVFELTFTSDSELTHKEFTFPPMANFTFNAYWEGTNYPVILTCSNSAITGFVFDQPRKQIRFELSGEIGNSGYCNVTIPKILLKGEPWTVKLNGTSWNFQQSENQTHSFIYFTYTHESTYEVVIKGTWVIPEFPTHTILPLFIVIFIIVIIFVKRKIQRKMKKHPNPIF